MNIHNIFSKIRLVRIKRDSIKVFLKYNPQILLLTFWNIEILKFSFLGHLWTCSKIMEEAEIHNKKWPASKMTQAHMVDHPISHLSSLSNAPMLRTRVGLGQYHTSVMFQISVKFVKKKSRSKRLGGLENLGVQQRMWN